MNLRKTNAKRRAHVAMRLTYNGLLNPNLIRDQRSTKTWEGVCLDHSDTNSEMSNRSVYSLGASNGYGWKDSNPGNLGWVLHKQIACAGLFQGPVSMAWHDGRKGAHNKTRRAGMRHAQQEHYSVLGLTADATSIDIKRAFRHLARQYHPDVNKELDAGDSFKSIRLAYEVLSNEATRAEYDKAMGLQELDPNSHWRNWTESELSGGRIYSWAELKHHMHRKNWEQRCETSTDSFSSYKDEDFGDENMEDREEPAGELFKQLWLMFFCSQFLGAQVALTLCGFHAMLNRRLAPGYKVAHMVAWLIGGQRGILLVFVLSFASLFCGKASDSLVALVSLALWIGVHLVKFVPLPQGAILVMTYMCFKLQLELS